MAEDLQSCSPEPIERVQAESLCDVKYVAAEGICENSPPDQQADCLQAADIEREVCKDTAKKQFPCPTQTGRPPGRPRKKQCPPCTLPDCLDTCGRAVDALKFAGKLAEMSRNGGALEPAVAVGIIDDAIKSYLASSVN